MQKLWRGAASPGPITATTGWLDHIKMPAFRLPAPLWHRRTARGHVRAVPAFPGRFGGQQRVFCAVEGLGSKEKGVDGEMSVGEEEERRTVLKGSPVVRRQRGEVTGMGNPDLLAIPGVGPVNLRKLVDKGYNGVDRLKQLYRDKFFGDPSEKMVAFLRSSVGIRNKNHAESITTFIKERVDGELKEETPEDKAIATPKKRLTFCVEGNISVGKSTFLQRIANDTLELRDIVEIVPEPVAKWQDIGPEHSNLLGAFYAEPERYAYTFQNYVFVTRVMQERESASGIKPLRLMERSIFSDRMVFVRAVHEAKWMNSMELNIYDSWFDPVVSSLPGLIPDAFIYLRATPDTCHKRMKMRKRSEEGGVSLSYLKGLHENHESWLFPSKTKSEHHGLSVGQLPINMDDCLHPDIKDRVFYLEGSHMHSSIQKVPALVLDCEQNIDFSRDIEAKEQYARQVAEFFEFVKKKKDAFPDVPATAGKSMNHLIRPAPDVWIPGNLNSPNIGNLNSPNIGNLNSPNIRKAMSFGPC